MDRIFNIGRTPLRVLGNSNQMQLVKADDPKREALITKTYINEKCFYQDEFVCFPAKRIIEKKTPKGRAMIVFGDQSAYGTSAPERYVRIEDNGCKFAFKEGRSGSKGIYRLYGNILGALQMEESGRFSLELSKKCAKKLKDFGLKKMLKIYR